MKRRWISIPVPPTKEMLKEMANATWLTDGSDLEMERRFNGMLSGVPKKRKVRRKK